MIGGGLSTRRELFLDTAVGEAGALGVAGALGADHGGAGARRRRRGRDRRGGARRSRAGAQRTYCEVNVQRASDRELDDRDDDRPRRPSTSSASTRSGRCRSTRSRRRTPVIPGRRWPWRRVAYLLYTRVTEAQPGQPGLVRPRPLRPLRRARVGAALLDPPPDRLRDLARRPEELPPARQPDRRPSGARGRRAPGRRGHDRPARPGRLERGRLRARRADARRALQPRPATRSIDHHTYAIASDGDMQEGISAEASSFAGHLGLGRLIVFYDNNHIQLAGSTDDVVQRERRTCATRPTAGTRVEVEDVDARVAAGGDRARRRRSTTGRR